MSFDRTGRPEDRLDPQMRRFLDESAVVATGYGDTFAMPLRQARAAIEAMLRPLAEGGPRMALSEDRWIQLDGRRIQVRLHVPEAAGAGGPVIVFLHGGGWVWNSIDTHDRVARELAARSGHAVVAPDYASAPEYPFPIPLLESVGVLEWLALNGAGWGLDGSRIGITGDSAGANLAVAACLDAAARGLPVPRAVLANYGAFDPACATDSFRWVGDSSLSPQTWKMRWFWQQYLGRPDTDDWRAAPALADLAGMPPLRVQVAELDTLCDEGLRFADKARAAGVDIEAEVYLGVTHGFLRAVGRVDTAARALQDGADWLRSRF